MKIWMVGLALSLFALQGALACGTNGDTVINVLALAGYVSGTNSGTLNPATALNSLLSTSGCTDTSLTIHLRSTVDTLKLHGPIMVARTNGNGRITSFVGEVGLASPYRSLIIVEDSSTAPTANGGQGYLFDATSPVQLSGFTVLRMVNSPTLRLPAIMLRGGKGSMVSGCQFWLQDVTTASYPPPSLIEIKSDSVLIERSLFRSPAGGTGYGTAIFDSSSGTKVEIRADVFNNTGVVVGAGQFHLYANTFVGTRDRYSPVVVFDATVPNADSANIQHNLFAVQNDTLPPIDFRGTPVPSSAPNVIYNAWTSSRDSLELTMSGAGPYSEVTSSLINNILMPKGFSNYGAAVAVKDYPLVELSSNPTLSPSDPTFGELAKIYAGYPHSLSHGQAFPEIDSDLTAAKLFFPNNFQPYVSTPTWGDNDIKVGAFSAVDANDPRPSPINLRAHNPSEATSLHFAPLSGDPTKISQITRVFDTSYYGAFFAPNLRLYFFSPTRTDLNAADSTSLKTATSNDYTGITGGCCASPDTVSVPRQARVAVAPGQTETLYLKLLHYNGTGQAVIEDPNAVVDTVTAVPAYPFNDLTLSYLDTTGLASGQVTLNVALGKEAPDSIRVYELDASNAVVDSSVPAHAVTGSKTFAFNNVPAGLYHFAAVPIGLGRLGVKTAGAITAAKFFRQITGDTVYVSIPAGTCPTGANGSAQSPYCTLAAGLSYLQSLSQGVLIIDAASQPIQDAVIATGSGPSGSLTITSMVDTSGKFPLNRPIFSDSTGGVASALTISRSNVTIQGVVFQMPPATKQAAVSVQTGGTGVVLESNLFRSTSRSGLVGTALSLGAASGHVSNNVFWGFSKAINIANASPSFWITENTFLNDSAFTGFAQAAAISASVSAVGTRIFHNFFADYTAPFDASFKGGTDTLAGNVYTAPADANLLQGHVEIRLMATANPIPIKDLSAANYGKSLSDSVFLPLENCNQLVECSPLYAGANPGAYESSLGYTAPAIDFFGNSRLSAGRPEIGAYEFQNKAHSVLGRLQFTVGFGNSFSQANVNLSSMNIDSLDADSVSVWWSTNKSDVYSAVPKANQLSYRVATLEIGDTIQGKASNLLPNVTYWFHSQLLKVGAASAGYIYTQSFQSDSLLTSSSCDLATTKGVCPSEAGTEGYFIDTTSGPFKGLYRTRIVFNTATPGNGTVQAPIFLVPDSSRLHGLTAAANAPMIRLQVQTTGNMGQPQSNEGYQVTVVGLSSLSSTLAANDLYLLPSASGGLPTYLSDWSFDTTGNLTIQLHSQGTLDLVFGKFPSTGGGTVGPASTNLQTYDYDGVAAQTFKWPLQGTSFRTANPLILATPVPCGGVTGKSVISSAYPVQSDLLSSGLIASVGDSLKYATALAYYRRVVSADSTAAFFAHQNRAFHLNAVASASDLQAAVQVDSLSMDNSGNASPTMQLTFGKTWKSVSDQATRGVEVILTVFDGGAVSYGHVFLQTKFSQADLGPQDQTVQYPVHLWNLYTYPWQEAPGGDISRVVGSNSFNPPNQKVLSYKGTGEGQDAYTVINATTFSSLTIDSGRAFWSGNGDAPYKPNTAGGFSLDNGDFSLSLTAGQYNDFGTPFNFSVKLQDVLDTSGLGAGNLAIYRLDYTGDKAGWTRMDATKSSLGVLSPWVGYTVKPAAAVSLKFPLIDTARSTTPLAKKAGTNAVAWQADIQASDAAAIATLSLSKGARAQQYGEAPQVPGQTFRIGFAAGGGDSLASEIEDPAAAGLQGHWPLEIKPQDGFTGLDLQLHQSTGKTALFLVETMSRQITPLTDSTLHLTPADVSGGDYNVVAGTAQYAQDFLNSVLGAYDLRLVNFPNPFTGSTSIRFSLPSTVATVAYRLRVFDFQGRLVWEKTWNGGASLNTTWDGRNRLGEMVPAGQYHLLLDAQPEGKPAFEARRKLIKLD